MSLTQQDVLRAAKCLGTVLSIAALAIFLHSFGKSLSVHETREMVSIHWLAMLLALILYLVAFLPMVLAWSGLARACGIHGRASVFAYVFLVSQIGKYLPGNVGHLLGRAYLAKRYGMAIEKTGIAMGLELAGVLIAGALLAATAALFGIVDDKNNMLPLVAGGAAVAAVGGSLLVVHLRIGPLREFAAPFFFSLVNYAMVFALLAGINVALVNSLAESWTWASSWRVAAALVVSWLIGFLAPGAPAGLGLREVSFVALLSGTYPAEVALLSAAGFRIVTMTGDIIAWLIGLSLKPARALPLPLS